MNFVGGDFSVIVDVVFGGGVDVVVGECCIKVESVEGMMIIDVVEDCVGGDMIE